MTKISNEAFNVAYKNSDNSLIMKKAANKFKYFLNKEELDSCKMVGLWKCLTTFNAESGMKFTTWLYSLVCWECIGEIKRGKRGQIGDDKEGYMVEQECNKEDLLSFIKEFDNQLIVDRIVQKFTLKELAERNNSTIGKIRGELSRSISGISQTILGV